MSTPPTLPDWCQVGATGAAYNPRVVNAYARDQFADLANQSHDLHRNLPPTAAAEDVLNALDALEAGIQKTRSAIVWLDLLGKDPRS